VRTGSVLDRRIKAVAAAFEKQLDKTDRLTNERMWLSSGRALGTASTGEDLVRVGLRALGFDAVKGLFGSRDKREGAGRPRPGS
jgi:hypothetical protein